MPVNCIIVEDEPLAQERLRDYILRIPDLHLQQVFENSLDALVYTKTHPVDLCFLDIHLEGISGIQLLENAQIGAQVILTTAYHEYAIKGYELNVTDYLLKPYSFERFLQAVEKAKTNLANKPGVAPPRYFFVKTAYKLEKVSYAEVLYIEGMRDYRKIHTIGRQIMTLQTFKELEKEIPPEILCRVHKSYMVAIDKIDTIEKDEIRIGNSTIYISDTYRDAFFKLITSRRN
ncbi:MAG: response regulator transcription factor [Sediminibacterium sp.]|nr:response regulator transcription factor [Sediminibacterium sp.]